MYLADGPTRSSQQSNKLLKQIFLSLLFHHVPLHLRTATVISSPLWHTYLANKTTLDKGKCEVISERILDLPVGYFHSWPLFFASCQQSTLPYSGLRPSEVLWREAARPFQAPASMLRLEVKWMLT